MLRHKKHHKILTLLCENFPAIVGSVVGAILSFLGKAVGFVAEHTCALIVFVVGFTGWWLMERVKKC